MSIEFWHEWKFLHVNWVEFTVIKLYFERDNIAGVSDISFGLLGLNCRLCWTHDPAKIAALLQQTEDNK